MEGVISVDEGGEKCRAVRRMGVEEGLCLRLKGVEEGVNLQSLDGSTDALDVESSRPWVVALDLASINWGN